MKRLLTSLLALLLLATTALAQSTSQAYYNYINTYYMLAIDQMRRYQIPASITLAQGLHESAAGTSTLAREANNHFGIKVSAGWTGPYVLRNDDAPNEKFRKYNSVQESYEDHSKFLHKDRYAPLFKLSIYDYKGWAHTLKKCGYATSSTYANNLIRIIETYNLTQYDHQNGTIYPVSAAASGTGYSIAMPTTSQQQKPQQSSGYVTAKVRPSVSADALAALTPADIFFQTHPVHQCNGQYYFVAQRGDNLVSISKATGISKRKLRKWNEMQKYHVVHEGDIIYLGSKHKRADKSMKGVAHVVKQGESIYSISQRYCVKMSSIYKINALPEDFVPVEGDRLRVY